MMGDNDDDDYDDDDCDDDGCDGNDYGDDYDCGGMKLTPDIT